MNDKPQPNEPILFDVIEFLRAVFALECEAERDLTAGLENSRLDAEEAECQGMSQ